MLRAHENRFVPANADWAIDLKRHPCGAGFVVQSHLSTDRAIILLCLLILPPFTCTLMAASVAEAELHGEVFLVVFEAGQVAVILDDPSMDDSERQMRSGDGRGGQDKMLDARFNPWLGDDRQPNNDGEKRKVFENRQREVGLLSRRLAGEGGCFG